MSEVGRRMDRMYRLQRFFYDLTRKYYLLGRDTAIGELRLQPGDRLCEVGCGTARNLVRLAKAYPNASLYGVDASAEMLRSARANLARSRLGESVRLARGTAQEFDPGQLFGLEGGFTHLLFSYSLSMMDDWQPAIEHARRLLTAGGSLHLVDFGDQAGLPSWFTQVLRGWLALFDVHVRLEVPAYLARQAAAGGGRLQARSLYGGYAYLATFWLVSADVDVHRAVQA